MKESIIIKLKDNHGGAYIEAAFVMLSIVWIIAVMTAFMPIFAQINKVNRYASNVARIISVEGGITGSALNKIESYKNEMQLYDVVLDYSESDIFDGYKIQLNGEVVVKTQTNYCFKFFGIPINIPIDVKALSRSEVYYK